MQTDFDTTAINMEELKVAKDVLNKRFGEMVEAYLEDSQTYLKGIEEGISSSDLEKIASNAHPLKSSSSGLGITGVSEIARAIEENARDGGEIDIIKPMIAPLKEALEHANLKLHSMLD